MNNLIAISMKQTIRSKQSFDYTSLQFILTGKQYFRLETSSFFSYNRSVVYHDVLVELNTTKVVCLKRMFYENREVTLRRIG